MKKETFTVDQLLAAYRPAIAEIHELLTDPDRRVARHRADGKTLGRKARTLKGQDAVDARQSANWHLKKADEIEEKLKRIRAGGLIRIPGRAFMLSRPSLLVQEFGATVLLHPWVADALAWMSRKAHDHRRVHNLAPETLTLEEIEDLPKDRQRLLLKDEVGDLVNYQDARDELKAVHRALDPGKYSPPKAHRDVRVAIAYRKRGSADWASIAQEFGFILGGDLNKVDALKVRSNVKSSAARGRAKVKTSGRVRGGTHP